MDMRIVVEDAGSASTLCRATVRRLWYALPPLFVLHVVLLVCLVALVVANTRQLKLSWVLGSSTASLVWIVLGSAVFRWRMRAPRA